MERDLKLRYRPQDYKDVVGQEEAIKLLQGTPMNAYLLHGHTGSGKTTLARIFAKENNAELVEIDSSSIGKSNVLDLRETAKYKPLTKAYKVILLDEVHALSNQAWQSLLKVIEEAPKTTIWMLVTTEIHKVPDTIKNRARSVAIRRIPYQIIEERLDSIVAQEKGELIEETTQIAVSAQGSMRLAIEYLQTYLETNVMPVVKDSTSYIDILNQTYGGDTQEFSKALKTIEDFTQDDINQLISVVSDIIVFFTMSTTRPKEEASEILLDYTSIYLENLDPLRQLMVYVHQKVDVPNLPSVVNEVYSLLHEIIKVYNKANDNRYTLKAVLTHKHMEWRER